MRRDRRRKNEERDEESSEEKGHKYTIKHYYRCFCHKIYSTYPALYLHVQRKHNMKISVDIEDKLEPVR